MSRFPRLFGRKPDDAAPAATPDAIGQPAPDRPAPEADVPPWASTTLEQNVTMSDPLDEYLQDTAPARTPAAVAVADPAPADPVLDPDRVSTVIGAERRSALLIGGDEADLVPVIPNTEVDYRAQASEFDEESALVAAVDALMGACRLLVERVGTLRRLQDGTQIIAGLIALVSELDMRYTSDWGILRRNGLETVLADVRESVPEGDRFILESLENGRGGLTADVFLRDLRTIAPADRPRMITNYAVFLVFVIKCVLRQYLHPLRNDASRLRDVSRRLDYLVDGVRDTLLSRINGLP